MKKQTYVQEDFLALTISKGLKALREKSGLGSKYSVARIADVSYHTYDQAEGAGDISIQNLYRLLHLYGLSFNEFISFCRGTQPVSFRSTPVRIQRWMY